MSSAKYTLVEHIGKLLLTSCTRMLIGIFRHAICSSSLIGYCVVGLGRSSQLDYQLSSTSIGLFAIDVPSCSHHLTAVFACASTAWDIFKQHISKEQGRIANQVEDMTNLKPHHLQVDSNITQAYWRASFVALFYLFFGSQVVLAVISTTIATKTGWDCCFYQGISDYVTEMAAVFIQAMNVVLRHGTSP